MPSELLDSAEQFVDVAGVLTDQKTFEHDRPDAAAAFTDLAVALESLVRQDFKNSRAVGTAYIADLDIRNLQIRRIGGSSYVSQQLFKGFFTHLFHLSLNIGPYSLARITAYF